MAKKPEVVEKVEKQELPPSIEELQKICKVPSYVYAGVCHAKGWSTGKRISQAEFEKAVTNWLKTPMKGR